MKITLEFELNQIEDRGEVSKEEIKQSLIEILNRTILAHQLEYTHDITDIYVDTTDGEEKFNVYQIAAIV